MGRNLMRGIKKEQRKAKTKRKTKEAINNWQKKQQQIAKG
jgi:hypothetical protein